MLFIRTYFFNGFPLFLYLRSTLPCALDAFIITVMNPAFKITVPLIASLSSEPENQDLKCNGNFGTCPLLIGFFFSSPSGYEGANKFIRNSPIRILFQLDVCHLYTSQVEQISNVLSLFSLLFRYRMHFKTISPIIPGRFTAETDILIFPFGYKRFLPSHFGLAPDACPASQAALDLGASIHHPPCPPKGINPALNSARTRGSRYCFQVLI